MLTKISTWLGLNKGARQHKGHLNKTPIILARSEHQVSRKDISKYALKVLYRLHEAGFQAYMVGGGVRDLLLGRHPKDFDLATNALPDQVAGLFRNCRLIGRRFRLAHVYFGGHIVEVATFRAASATEVQDHPLHETRTNHVGMLVRDNVYGTSLEEDVARRDFTINALYYNIADFSIIDYVGGLEDLKTGTLRMIGEPYARYREDPVRILRAIRFAAKLKFKIHEDTAEPFSEMLPLLLNVPQARIFDEYLKLFLSGHAFESYQQLKTHHLFAVLFPRTNYHLHEQHSHYPVEGLLSLALKNTDKRLAEGKTVAPHFLLAVFLWYPVKAESDVLIEKGHSEYSAFHEAFQKMVHLQHKTFAIPKRLIQMVREVLSLQLPLKIRNRARLHAVLAHDRFRAAYDFLLLRSEANEPEAQGLAEWWTEYLASDEAGRAQLLSGLPQTKKRRKHKFRRKKPLLKGPPEA